MSEMSEPYLVPSITQRTETESPNRALSLRIAPTPTVMTAKAFLASVRAEMPECIASCVCLPHLDLVVPLLKALSDDGEPSGTSGPPVLAVLRGSGIGDISVVVTRYFGGTKLGTGGLVRAYTEATQLALKALPTELKIAKVLVGVELNYHQYTPIKRMLPDYEAEIESEDFGATITLMLKMPTVRYNQFTCAVVEQTAGSVTPLLLSE